MNCASVLTVTVGPPAPPEVTKQLTKLALKKITLAVKYHYRLSRHLMLQTQFGIERIDKTTELSIKIQLA